MASNYDSENQNIVEMKTRAGEYKTKYLKGGNFLPNVFDTELTRKWLDSTLDQMISKGDLQDIDAYIGSKHGKFNTANDLYLKETIHSIVREKAQLAPAYVSLDHEGNIKQTISFDDVINHVNNTFNDYNFGSAYSTDAYTFAPPINIDKFVNYSSYFWVPDMPVYKSTSQDVDIEDITGRLVYKWQDSDNTFWLQNNQRIRLAGVDNCTYMVTGVGHGIKLIKIFESDGTLVYDFETAGSPVETGGLWDNAFDLNNDGIADNPDEFDYDESPWDSGTVIVESFEKDYIVIDRSDADNTAWSRNNNWASHSTILEWANIVGFDYRLYTSLDRVARRPIIDFNPGIVKVAQEKTRLNQAPLFRLQSYNGTWIDEFPESYFTGNKIFGYKESTGINDPELGFPVAYRDSDTKAEMIFENFLNTVRYTTSTVVDGINGLPRKEIPGLYYYVENGNRKMGYESMALPMTAKAHINKVVDTDEDIEFNVGKADWDINREIIVKYNNTGEWTISEIFYEGVYVNQTVLAPTLVLGRNVEYKLHNLIPNTRLVFFNDGEIPTYANGVDGIEASVTMPSNVEYILYAPIDSNDNVISNKIGKIILVDDTSYQRHSVYLNGRKLSKEEYTLTDENIVVSHSILKENDILDIEYIAARTDIANITQPEVMQYNASNEIISDFTLGETLNHWSSILETTPGFEGQAFGKNNTHRLPQIVTYGGEILLHADSVAAYTLAQTDKMFNPSQALREQGRDWWTFKQRFISQVARLYKTKTYRHVGELVDDVLKTLISNKVGTVNYRNSNMLFYASSVTQNIVINSGVYEVELDQPPQGDTNIRDHVYVYLRDYKNGKYIERLLLKDVDYTISGSTLILNIVPSSYSTNDDAYIKVCYHAMDSDSFVPQSLVKLFLDMPYVPSVNGSILRGHDGDEYTISGVVTESSIDSILYDITSSSFDPIAAALFDMEKRIYAGLVNNDALYRNSDVIARKYAHPESLKQSQHRSTWFDNKSILEDQYTFKYFREWEQTSGRSITQIEPDVNDVGGWSWNYSHISVGEHLSSTLPGYWKAAYTTLFDTDTPHLNPWHMLGFAFKPAWWDEYYSWTDSVKRSALINALRYGIISSPASAPVTDVKYARYYWDWEQFCPVDEQGQLESPINVLVHDADSRAFDQYFAKPHVYSDWSNSQMAWRKSSIGRAVLISGLLDLVPAKAWTTFYQPGIIDTIAVNTVVPLNSITKKINTDTPALVSGDTGTVIDYVEVLSDNGTLLSDQLLDVDSTEIKIVSESEKVLATANFTYADDIRISNIILNDRGFGFNNGSSPIVLVSNNIQPICFIATEILTKTVNYISNGIAEVLSNYAKRNNYNETAHALFENIESRMMQKLAGYSAKSLLNISAETTATGSVRINDADYEVIMYKGMPTSLFTASAIKIIRNGNSYNISGYSPNKQEFYFYEPVLGGNTKYSNIAITDGGQTIRRYEKFNTVESVIEYDAGLTKIQDLYNFIRGYYRYLNTVGYEFEISADKLALDAATWAVSSEDGDSHIVSLGNILRYTPEHGTVMEINTLANGANNVLSQNGSVITSNSLEVSRTHDYIDFVLTDSDIEIGSVTFAVIDFEHALVFNRMTSFNRTLFNDVINQRYHRLKLRGQRTKDWHGDKHAPGYLIFEDKVIQNFDSSVEAINDFYNNDVTKFNDGIETAERLTNGNISHDWINTFNIAQNTVNDFYRGVLRDKGTNSAIDNLGRAKLINAGNSTVSHNEVWMFRNNLFGDVTNTNATEFEVDSSEIKNNPQAIQFSDTALTLPKSILNIIDRSKALSGEPRYVNGTTPTFATVPFANRELNLSTAGDLLDGESDHTAISVGDIPEIFGSFNGIGIESWNERTSYKRGDIVRHQGKLYKCDVVSTGLSLVGSNITIAGEERLPYMSFGSSVSFRSNPDSEYTDVSFGTLANDPVDIAIVGSVENPIVYSYDSASITIDGVVVSLEKKEQILQSNIYPVTPQGVYLPTIDNTLENRYLNINGVSIDLGEPGAPTIPDETIYGNATQQTYSLSQNLGTYSSVFDIEVARVEVAGVVQGAEIDYTVDIGSNTITFTAPLTTPSDTYVEAGYVEAGYVAGEVIDIVVTYKAVNTKDYAAIKERIEDTLPNVFVFLDAGNRFRIRGTVAGDNESITIGEGSANSALGLSAGTYYGGDSYVYAHSFLDLTDQVDSILTRINTANIPGVFVSDNDGRLRITSSNPLINIQGPSDVLDYLGIAPGQRTASTIVVQNPSDVTEISEKLNMAFVAQQAGIISAVANGYLILNSDTEYLEIIGTEFCDNIGLPTTGTITDGPYIGEKYSVISSQSETIRNTFNDEDWNDITVDDPAQQSVWVTDDSEFGYVNLGNIQVKYDSWNLYKFMNFGYYSKDSDNCSICAGNTTSDGNDAQITMYKDGSTSPHYLQVGDYVMILNSTTSPSVDGIHKVTRVHSIDPSIFYIDMYIEDCGTCDSILPMRSLRFTTRESAAYSLQNILNYRYQVDDLLFVTPVDAELNQIGTYVYTAMQDATSEYVSTLSPEPYRSTTTRTTNQDLLNISTYTPTANNGLFELEVYDPMRGILPGIATKELDIVSPVDFAVYTTSTDETYAYAGNQAWGIAEVGKVWWDTRTAKYYDYTQGDINYRSKYWGKLFPGSTIDIYEWVRSSLPPDEWDKAAEAKKQIFDDIASGTAYKIFDAASNDYIYYYTESNEWNSVVGEYVPVYYFWVKNKTTITTSNRLLSAKAVADILTNPTANGISWCAAIDSTAIVVGNISTVMSSGSNVLQINKRLTVPVHSSWTAIAEHTDIIPEYWYKDLRDNLVGYESRERTASELDDWNTWNPLYSYSVGDIAVYDDIKYIATADISYGGSFITQRAKGQWVEEDNFILTHRLPNPTLHTVNMYGDDKTIKQGWFKDKFLARREAIYIANRFIRNINLIDSLNNIWDRRLKDHTLVWEWVDYVAVHRPINANYTAIVDRVAELDDIDTTKHTYVKLNSYDYVNDIDRSEIHRWTGSEWDLIEKKNATIQFNDWLYNNARLSAWDASPWDSRQWDEDKERAMYDIVEALRHDIFIKDNTHMFNAWWFGLINYVISEHDYIDWLYKTTYINVDVYTPIETESRRYSRNTINELIGYVNTVKPFHTKIKEVFDKNTIVEEAKLYLADTSMIDIVVDMPRYDTISNDSEYTGTVYDGGIFMQESITGGISDWGYDTDDVLNAGDFIQPEMYNMTSLDMRRHVYNMDIEEQLSISVITNTDSNLVDTDTRTFVYLQNHNLGTASYSLLQNNTYVVSETLNEYDDVIILDSAIGLPESGNVYINGEIIRYAQVIVAGGKYELRHLDRGIDGTRAKVHAIGSHMVLLGDALTMEDNLYSYESNGNGVSRLKLNVFSNDDTMASQELEASGQGMVF